MPRVAHSGDVFTLTNNYDDEFQFNGAFPSADDYILSDVSFKPEDVFEPSYNPDVPYGEMERIRNEIDKHLLRPEVILLRAPWGIGKTTLMIRNYWWHKADSAPISQSYEHLETHIERNGVLKHQNVIIVKGLDKLCPVAQKNPDRVAILRNMGFETKKIHKIIIEEAGEDYDEHILQCPYNQMTRRFVNSIKDRENIKIGTVFTMALNNLLLRGKIRYWFIDEEQGISNLVKLIVPEDLVRKLGVQGMYISNWAEMEEECTQLRNELQEEFLKTNDEGLTVQSKALTNLLEILERRIILPNKDKQYYTSHEGGLAEVWTTPIFHLFLLRLARVNQGAIAKYTRSLATPHIMISSASAKFNHLIPEVLNLCLGILRRDITVVRGITIVPESPWGTPIADITSDYPLYKTSVVAFHNDKQSYSKLRIDETSKFVLLNHLSIGVIKYLQLQNTNQLRERSGLNKDNISILLVINSKKKALEMGDFVKHTYSSQLRSLVMNSKLIPEAKNITYHIKEIMYPGDALAGYNPPENINLIVIYGEHIHKNINFELGGLDEKIVASRSGASLREDTDPKVAKYIMDANLTDIIELVKRSRGKRDVVYIGKRLNPNHQTMGKYVKEFCDLANVEVLPYIDI